MRLSVRSDDPGYRPLAIGARVTLDGVALAGNCFTADEELGEAHCFRRDPTTGNFIVDRLTGFPEEEILRGQVKIELVDGIPP